MDLDRRDHMILHELQADGRMSNADLAAAVGMSPSNCLRRTRSLEKAGLIRGYTAILDAKLAGYQLAAYILVNLDQRTETDAETFLELVGREERIIECVALTGEYDFLLKVVIEDIEALGTLTMNSLLKLSSVKGLTSSVVIKSYKVARAVQV